MSIKYSVDELKSELDKVHGQKNTTVEIRIDSSNFKVYLKDLIDLLHVANSSNYCESSSDETTLILPFRQTLDPFDKSMFKRVLLQPTLNLNMADMISVKDHFVSCLTELQQLTCKLIAKAWIKQVAPKKQSTHPYKGKNLTKPTWWPQNARHREPDHLMKSERISLMLNILMIPDLIDIPMLMAATNECYSALSENKLAILFEIYLVKEKLDQHARIQLEVSDFLLYKASRPRYHALTKTTVNNDNLSPYSSRMIPTIPMDDDSDPATRSCTPEPLSSTSSQVSKFNDENVYVPSLPTHFQTSTPNTNRKPLSRKDPNLPPLKKRTRLENAANDKIDKLYLSSKALSPRHILSSSSQYKIEEPNPSAFPQLLPPMRMMKTGTVPGTFRNRVSSRLISAKNSNNAHDIEDSDVGKVKPPDTSDYL